MIAAIGGRGHRAVSRVWVAAAIVVLLAGLLVDGSAPAHGEAIGRSLTKLSQLKDAPIPASCGHKATRLHGFSRNFGTYRGFASLDTKRVVFVALGRSPRKYAVIPLDCSAGGVSWPELLLVYSVGPHLVGSVDLGRIKTAQEHEDVARLRPATRKVHVVWRGYEGAGFTVSTYTGTLTLAKGRVTLHHTGPLTIDYSADEAQSGSFGPGIYRGSGDRGLFYPARKTFISFVVHRYRALRSKYGAHGTAVMVIRLSHRGFAFAAESMGWESVVLYGKIKGEWNRLGNWGDGPECRSLSHLQRRGLTITHGFCFTDSGSVKYLGSWPHSGQ
jgi:hypothetical protein